MDGSGTQEEDDKAAGKSSNSGSEGGQAMAETSSFVLDNTVNRYRYLLRTRPAQVELQDPAIAQPGREFIQRLMERCKTVDFCSEDLEKDTPSPTREIAEEIDQAISSFSILRLGDFGIGDIGARALGLALQLNKSVTSVDLGFNSITDRGAEWLAACFRKNRSLSALYLSGNCIGPPGAGALAAALSLNSTLTTLFLSGNSIGSAGAEQLYRGLASNNSLKVLYISSNNLGSDGAGAIAALMLRNHSIEDWYLSQNSIGDRGMKLLAKALAQATAVRTLELGMNNVHAEGAVEIANALGQNKSVRTLYLDNNPLGDAGVAEFGTLLARNETLQVLDLGFSGCTVQGLQKLAVGLQRNAALIALFVPGNSLVSPQDAKGVRAARLVAAAMLSNPRCQLRQLTGVRLSVISMEIRLPLELHDSENEEILSFLRERLSLQIAAAAAGGRTQGSASRRTEGSLQVTGQVVAEPPRTLVAPPTFQYQSPPDRGGHKGREGVELGEEREEGVHRSPSQAASLITRHHLGSLQAISQIPFDNHELDALQNHYSSITTLELAAQASGAAIRSSSESLEPVSRGESLHKRAATSSMRDMSEAEVNSRKKVARSRVSKYQLIQRKIARLQAEGDSAALLTLLRQLNFLERTLKSMEDPNSFEIIDNLLGADLERR